MLGDAQRRGLIESLSACTAFDEAERGHVERTIELLDSAGAPFSRSNLPGHITASAIVWNPRRGALLLVLHPKFREWYQPGGHCEPALDDSVAAAALRELIEETALQADEVESAREILFDVDVHPIPAWGPEPAHEHHDVRYLFQCTTETLPRTDHQSRWTPLREVRERCDASLARVAGKLLDR